MADFLEGRFGIQRGQIQLMEMAIYSDEERDLMAYAAQMHGFSERFWARSRPAVLPRSHPGYLPYNGNHQSSISYPGVRPDGGVYACAESPTAMRVGHISDADVTDMLIRMLRLRHLSPAQCDRCVDGAFVQCNYAVLSKARGRGHE